MKQRLTVGLCNDACAKCAREILSLPPPHPASILLLSLIISFLLFFPICVIIHKLNLIHLSFQVFLKFIYILTAKEKENALLKETLIERDKEIVDLKEKLSQLQQNGPRNQLDFAKQMAIMDEKLQETRKNIEELENGLNFSLLKKETKFKSEPQTFNGEWGKRDASTE